MADTETLSDIVERIRAEKFPHLDRTLVLEILRMHADATTPAATLAVEVDQAIRLRLKKVE
ncbi:MAG: hypothetical protein JNL14_19540 [Devosia sp.]|uniref:hypothetical protein n=1 Tax=Devosia sp. TaxID=1871048 RepID=UPI001A40241F|nr:hypothetical protein [Devosia sp.]MBL8599936.1 hypothetical protein [Devosia sp.]